MHNCIVEISSRREPIKQFYIGKTAITKKKDSVFSINDSSTWTSDGVRSRYNDHKVVGHGSDGLIVLAVLTEKSIPEHWKAEKFITDHEEYALILEKRLIEEWMEDSRLANATKNPGKTSDKTHEAYAVYMAFSFNGMHACMQTLLQNHACLSPEKIFSFQDCRHINSYINFWHSK